MSFSEQLLSHFFGKQESEQPDDAQTGTPGDLPSLDALQARFYEGLGLPGWQRQALSDPRLNAEVTSRLILASALAGLQDAVLALVARLDPPAPPGSAAPPDPPAAP
jgi:hypothetical protein